MKFTQKIRIKIKEQSGMTLAEIMVVMGIFVILTAGMLMVFNTYADYWNVNRTKVELQQDLRLAMIRLSSDLRRAVAGTIDLPAGSSIELNENNQMTFDVRVASQVPGWSSFTIMLDDQGRLWCNEKIIAYNVKHLGFSRESAQPSIINVDFEMEKSRGGNRTIARNLDFSIQLRN